MPFDGTQQLFFPPTLATPPLSRLRRVLQWLATADTPIWRG
jgi:hypothetical protein